MFGLLVPKTTKEWQVRLPGDRCYGSPWQRYPLETDRHSELKMAVPNRSQFVSWKYHIPYLSSLFENFLSLLVFKSYKLVFKSQLPQTQTILQKDLLRQSSIQFLKSFCSCWTFDIHIPFKSSAGLVIVSSFFYFVFLIVQVKVFLWSRKGSCHSSRVLWGRRCVYVCRRKRSWG